MTITAVYFDFYGTLADWRQPVEASMRKVAVRYGLALDWSRLPEARQQLEAAWVACGPDGGTLATMERLMAAYQDYVRLLGAREHVGQLAWEVAQADHSMFTAHNTVVYPDTRPALDALRGAGLRLGVISNFHTPLYNILEFLEIEGYFEAVIASHDERVRCEKPDRRIFELAMTALGVAPAEAVYVGDTFAADVVGADGAGMHAVYLDRTGSHGDRWPRAITSLAALPALVASLAEAP